MTFAGVLSAANTLLLCKKRSLRLFEVWRFFNLEVILIICTDVDEVDFTPEPFLRPGKLDSQLKPWERPPPVAPPTEDKPPREVRVRLSITETDIVVVEDLSSFSSNAVVLKVC